MTASHFSQVAERYSRVLHELAAVDQVRPYADFLSSFAIALGAHGASAMLMLPGLSAAQRAAAIVELAAARGADATMQAFLRTVAHNGRIEALGAIAQAYAARVCTQAGEVAVRVVCAGKLSAAQQKGLVAQLGEVLSGKPVVSFEVDASVLGGAVVYVGSQRLDGSVAGSLKRLESKLYQAVA